MGKLFETSFGDFSKSTEMFSRFNSFDNERKIYQYDEILLKDLCTITIELEGKMCRFRVGFYIKRMTEKDYDDKKGFLNNTKLFNNLADEICGRAKNSELLKLYDELIVGGITVSRLKKDYYGGVISAEADDYISKRIVKGIMDHIKEGRKLKGYRIPFDGFILKGQDEVQREMIGFGDTHAYLVDEMMLTEP